MGGYNFNLLGDDEEQKKLEEQQAVLQQLVGDDPPPPNSVDQTPAPLQASTTDPKVADFQARLDQAKAARASSMGSTDDSSVLDDLVAQHEHRSHTAGDIDTALAMLLDVGANKGRGLGQIVGAYSRNREEESNQDEHFKEQVAFAKAKRKDVDPVAELMRQKQLEIGIEGLGARSAHEAGVEGRAEHNWAQNESPDAPKQTTAVKVAELKAAAGVKGREDQRAEMLPTIENTEGGITGARTTAGTQSKNDTPPDITPAEQARLDLEKQAHEDSQRHVAAVEANTAESKRQGELNSFRTQTKDMLVALQKARDLQKQIDAAPGNVPGLSNWQYNEPNLMLDPQAIHNQEILQQLINPETKRYFGTAVSANEASARERAYGTGRLSGEAAREEAIKTIREGLESGVRGAGVGREDVARQVLKEYGLDDLIPAQAAAVIDDAPASARDALPQVRVPDPIDVPTTAAGMQQLQQSAPSLGVMPDSLRKKYDKYRSGGL